MYSTIYYDRLSKQYRYILCIRENPKLDNHINNLVRKIQREILSPFQTFSNENSFNSTLCIYGLWNKTKNDFFSLYELNEIITILRSFGYVINNDLSNLFSNTSWLSNPDNFIAVFKKIDI